MVHSSEMRGTRPGWRLIASIVSAAILIIALGSVGTYALSEQQLDARISVRNAAVSVPSDIAAVQYGQHLAGAIALCTQCHGANLTGAVVSDDARARVVAPNITRGGAVAAFSDADYVRAIRDGIGTDGRPLWLMPADEYGRLSDTDLGALIAYLKSLPPVTSTLPTSEVRPLGRLQLALGQTALLPATEVDHTLPQPPAPDPGLTPEYGAYLVTIAGCARCHGPGLSGGTIPGAPRGAPQAANLTPTGLGNWTETDFLRAMRSGRRPDGRAIDPTMPWPYYAQMSELELRAIWQFLGVIPSRATGTG
jgi:cytochrome c553